MRNIPSHLVSWQSQAVSVLKCWIYASPALRGLNVKGKRKVEAVIAFSSYRMRIASESAPLIKALIPNNSIASYLNSHMKWLFSSFLSYFLLIIKPRVVKRIRREPEGLLYETLASCISERVRSPVLFNYKTRLKQLICFCVNGNQYCTC